MFLGSSVLLAASGSSIGASRALFSFAKTQDWLLVSSPYALSEVQRNLDKLPASAALEWSRLRASITFVEDVVSLDRPVIFAASKDRPILFTALAWAHVLLTLDKAGFAEMLDGIFYGMSVLLPYEFLYRERAAGRLSVAT